VLDLNLDSRGIRISSKMEDIRVRRVVQTEDLSNVEFETSEDVEVIPTFDNMGLREELLRGIYAYGKYFKTK